MVVLGHSVLRLHGVVRKMSIFNKFLHITAFLNDIERRAVSL